MYIAQGQGHITQEDKILIETRKVRYIDHILLVSASGLKCIFRKMILQYCLHT